MTYQQVVWEALVAALNAKLPGDRALRRVTDLTGISAERIMSDDRECEVVRARWSLMFVLRCMGLSLPSIGRVMARDHSTVHYGLEGFDQIAHRKVGPGAHTRREVPMFRSRRAV